MTVGEKIKQLRNENGLSQEKLAEKLNVSRSAVAKWETDGGIPEIDNLIQLAAVFDISLDELLGNTKGQKTNKEADRPNCENHNLGNMRYDIELTGWNDGVYGVYIISEDRDFLYCYQGSDKGKGVYGMIGRKYITSVLQASGNEKEKPYIEEVDKSFFCAKNVKIEVAKREGLIRGLLDFRDDAYRNVVIDSFDADTIHLQFGGSLELGDIAKIEETNE